MTPPLARVATSLLLALSLSAAACRCAPAPLPRRGPEPPAAVPERCLMRWQGTPYRAVFAPGGNYAALALPGHGTSYEGAWRLDPTTRVLAISERPLGSDGCCITYLIHMDGRLREGRFWGGEAVGFVLTP